MEITDVETLNLPANFTIASDFPSDRFMKVRLEICHDGTNRNKTSITTSVLDKASESLPYTPILAYVYADEIGKLRFGNHAVHVEEDQFNPDSDTYRKYYDEVPIGIIPENCNYELRRKDGKMFVCADGYIWREYSNYAEDIIKHNRTIPVSMEIKINDFTFNKSTEVYNLLDFRYKGVTCCDDPNMVGMAGANLTVNDSYAIAEKYQATTADEVLKLMAAALQEELEKYTKGANELDENAQVTPEEEVTLPEEAPTEPEEEITDEPAEQNTSEESEPSEESAPDSEPEASDGADEPAPNVIDYSLQSNVIESISEALNSYKIDVDGYAYPKYFLEDLDIGASCVYVYDVEDGRVYASDFTMSGDKVTLDGNFRRQVVEYRDYTDTVPASSPTPSAQFTRKLAEEVVSMKGAKEELYALREFKENYETEQRKVQIEEVLNKFTDLSKNAEFQELKINAEQYSVADLEKECYAIRGKSMVADTYSASKKEALRQNRIPHKSESASGVLAILEKFKRG